MSFKKIVENIIAAAQPEGVKSGDFAKSLLDLTEYVKSKWSSDSWYGFDVLEAEIPTNDDEIVLPDFSEEKLEKLYSLQDAVNSLFIDLLIRAKTPEIVAAVVMLADVLGTEMIPVIAKFGHGFQSPILMGSLNMIRYNPRAWAVGLLMRRYYTSRGINSLTLYNTAVDELLESRERKQRNRADEVEASEEDAIGADDIIINSTTAGVERQRRNRIEWR